MDELKLLREYQPVAAGPSSVVIRQAKDELMQTINQSVDGPTSIAHPSHRPRRSFFAIGAAVATAAAVIGGAIVGFGPGDGIGRTPAASALEKLANAAADHRVAGSGTVAHTRSHAEFQNTVQSTSGTATTVADAVTREVWIAPDGRGRIRQTRGTVIEDEAYNDLQYTDFAGWPTDVDGVLAKLRAEAQGSGMRPVDAEAFVLAGDYLRETAAPPAIRAAIFSAVGRLDGVRALGTVQDHDGRPGIGFEIDSDASHDSRWQLIFDSTTTELLGEFSSRLNGDVMSWTVYDLSELVAEIPPVG